jgi:two-component system sensor histidine kinase CpxA
MNSLFTRVFISFWIVLGIIIAGCVATTTMVAWHRIAELSAINFEQMNKNAEAALRSSGEVGLKSWLRDVGAAYPGVDIYLLDGAGHDLLDRTVPARLQEWLARGNGQKLITGNPGQSPLAPSIQYSASHLLESSQISATNGQNFTLAVAWFGSSPIDVLGSYDIVLGLLVLTILVSATASWLLARYISAPIHDLQQGARILAGGNLDAKVGERFSRRNDEIGTLARDFNHMAAELKSQIQAKEILLRDISHELRSPLARIQVALGLATLDRANVEVQHQRIERDIERMNELIEEIIRLERLNSAPQSFQMEDLDFSLLLDQVVEDVSLEAKVGGRSVVLTRPESLTLRGNPEMLRRAVENVLRNAIRFSPENAQIEISASQQSDRLAICVRDHGPGVPDVDLQRIFEPFYRVSVSRERDMGGTGLGLAITARVISLHQGEVSASNHPGGGLVVMMVFPTAFHSSSKPTGVVFHALRDQVEPAI